MRKSVRQDKDKRSVSYPHPIPIRGLGQLQRHASWPIQMAGTEYESDHRRYLTWLLGDPRRGTSPRLVRPTRIRWRQKELKNSS